MLSGGDDRTLLGWAGNAAKVSVLPICHTHGIKILKPQTDGKRSP
jgi:hypothetical protein